MVPGTSILMGVSIVHHPAIGILRKPQQFVCSEVVAPSVQVPGCAV